MVLAIAAVAASPASADYRMTTEWGGRGSGDGLFDWPRDIAVAPDGSVYVADMRNHRVQRFTPDGRFVSKLGGPAAGSAYGQFAAPSGLDVDSAGNLYVADRDNHRIQKFAPNGSFMTAFGVRGAGPSEFFNPVDVAVTSTGDFFVLDSGHRTVQRLAADGTFIRQWGAYGTRDGEFEEPSHIAVDAAGAVYVTDSVDSSIQKFDSSNGSLLATWGKRAPTGEDRRDRGFGIDVDSEGNVFAAYLSRIEKFTPTGTWISGFGPFTRDLWEFAWGTGVATHPRGGIYITDVLSGRIYRFRELPPEPPLPPPVAGKTVNVRWGHGTVKYTRKGSRRPVLIRRAHTQIPMGSTLNITNASVALTTARDAAGRTQTDIFSNGVFRISQRVAAQTITELRLAGGSFRPCRRSRRASPWPVRRLSGTANGHYRVIGRYSSATARRATSWRTEDRCDGTLTHVRRGQVVVRDLVRKRNIRLRTGQRYLARPRR